MSDNKTVYFKVRITPTEKIKLQEDADKRGVTVSQYARETLGLEDGPGALALSELAERIQRNKKGKRS